MNIPKFTADASLTPHASPYQGAGDAFSSTEQLVIPQRMATCARNSSRFCEFMCDLVGGGMTSNADGTVSCHY